jgi:hypothetical protein
MGYGMSQTESKFRIHASDKAMALRAIKALTTEKKISWVDADTIKRCRTLAAAMSEWRWDIEEEEEADKDGDIIGIAFSGEKAGDDLDLFKAIAPFVVSGSFIEMHGEDGVHWRWFFTDKTCVEKTAKVSWD